jgi:hypothetical protein
VQDAAAVLHVKEKDARKQLRDELGALRSGINYERQHEAEQQFFNLSKTENLKQIAVAI